MKNVKISRTENVKFVLREIVLRRRQEQFRDVEIINKFINHSKHKFRHESQG